MLKELEFNQKDLDNLISKNIVEDSNATISSIENKIAEQKNILSKLETIKNSTEGSDFSHVISEYYETLSNHTDKLSNLKHELNEINGTLESLLLTIVDNIKENSKNPLNLDFEKVKIDEDIPENNILTISEKENKVTLPYTKLELKEYLAQYPDKYSSYEEIIQKEFVYPLSYYNRATASARFRETYSLIHDREGKTFVEALKHGLALMFRYEINPAIIAACKTESQLELYLNCLENEKLDEFNEFVIKFEMNPSKNYHNKSNIV